MKTKISERGQSLVEISVSMVLLLIILSGAVEFGVAFFQYVQLQDAAQEGAFYGALTPSDCTGIIDRAEGASNSPVNMETDPAVTITVTIIDYATNNEYPCTSTGADNFDCELNGVRVDIYYGHKIFMPFLPKILNRQFLLLHAEVTDTILTPPSCT